MVGRVKPERPRLILRDVSPSATIACMRSTPARAALVFWAMLVVLAGAVVAPAQTDDVAIRAATDLVMRQLEAFRRDDFEAAYALASREIRRIFDRAAFERMVRSGYPEIAQSAGADVEASRQTGDGQVYLRLRIRGANGRSVEAVYEMVREGREWKVNGVIARVAPTT